LVHRYDGFGSPQPTMSQIHSMKVVAGAGLNFGRTHYK